MTRFEKDFKEALCGEATEVLRRRKAEIQKLEDAKKRTRNSFRRRCIVQDIMRLTGEYDEIDALVG